MPAGPCTALEGAYSPLGIHRGSRPGHCSIRGARRHWAFWLLPDRSPSLRTNLVHTPTTRVQGPEPSEDLPRPQDRHHPGRVAEDGLRLAGSLKHRDWRRAKRQAHEFTAGFAGPVMNGKPEAEPLTLLEAEPVR